MERGTGERATSRISCSHPEAATARSLQPAEAEGAQAFVTGQQRGNGDDRHREGKSVPGEGWDYADGRRGGRPPYAFGGRETTFGSGVTTPARAAPKAWRRGTSPLADSRIFSLSASPKAHGRRRVQAKEYTPEGVVPKTLEQKAYRPSPKALHISNF
ncbi:hypothetical protein AXG93_900s1000 [Marchantia polymorpha subsp. ruderalis]|uniref:Uncharacterized protein n=1 Tax=Marchantia polymorpha subsp. ruderalis TaxID=1480154 RepID=A0A176W3S0_MARPO|nr:hypothetical protein AXG93_900s1000 [Marchantia polymorpha subsp. ruderalis]